MTERKLANVYAGDGFHWVGDGFYVTQVLPGTPELQKAADPFLLLLVAATVSMLLSLFFLAKLRDRFSADVADRIEQRRSRKHSEATAPTVEDAETDSFR